VAARPQERGDRKLVLVVLGLPISPHVLLACRPALLNAQRAYS
jgi:hypothetical protein